MLIDRPPPSPPAPGVVVRRARPPRGVPAQYAVPDVGLSRLLDDAVQDFPDGVALDHCGRRLRYRELVDRVDRLAGVLADLGVAGGDRVVIALPSSPSATIALFAVWRLGGVAVLLDPSGPAHAEALVADAAAGARVVVRHDRLPVPPRADVDAEHVLVAGPEDDLPFPRNLAAATRRWLSSVRAPRIRHGSRSDDRAPSRMAHHIHRRAPLIVPDDHRGLALRVVEGGRVACYDHAALVAAAFLLRLWLPDALAGTERIASAMPLHDAVGVTAGVTTPVLVTATAILPRRVGRRALAQAVDRSDPTVVITPGDVGTRPVPLGWLENLRRPTGSLRVVLQRGAVEAQEVDAVHDRTGARLRGFWCPAGAAGPVSAEPVYGPPRTRTVGIPLTGTHVVVHAGRLVVSGPHLACDWPLGGWLETDQTGRIDDDGYVLLDTGPAHRSSNGGNGRGSPAGGAPPHG